MAISKLLPFFLFSLFVLPVFAVEEEGEGDDDFYIPYTYQQVYALPDGARIITADDVEPTDVDISVQALDPVTPANSNGFKSVLLDVLGDYSAIVVEYRYTNTNGTYSYLRETQPDYVWIASACIFGAMIWSLFRLVGVFFCKR